MKKIQFIFFFLFLSISSFSQLLAPVKWTFSETADKQLQFQAAIEKGWYIYDTKPDGDDYVPTSVTFTTLDGASLAGDLQVISSRAEKTDPFSRKKIFIFENEAIFLQNIKIENPDSYLIEGNLRFMSCDGTRCLSPVEESFTFGNASPIPSEVGDIMGAGDSPLLDGLLGEAFTSPPSGGLEGAYWQPVEQQSSSTSVVTVGLWAMFALGLLGGFIALVTPCVWPIIPFTISFFLKRTGNSRKNLRDAFLYGVSIIVIYVGLGLLITAVYGASALNSLSTSAFFNLFFFALLVVFGISFLGAFEITLPSSWSSKVDRQAESSKGIWGIFLMAFTLALVSFSCTGPIIGTLLVAVSVEGSYLAPTAGMLGFAVALALPFMLTAMFPSFLKSLPKSGSWMNTIKVSIGFLELALALKFLSVADLAYGWGILDREVFLSLWIVIFGFLGLYLAGIILLPHDNTRKVGVVRLFFAMISLAFAVYLVPGLWGAPLKATSAFAPPLYTQDFNLYQNEVHAKFTDFEQGLDFARKENKNVLLNFTGYGCVNCRKMEASVWTDPEVSRLMNEDFVLISLFVDDKTTLPEPVEITENDQTRLLKTVGDKWSYLQRYKFKSNAQPFCIILDNDGNALSQSIGYTTDVKEFLQFLNLEKKIK